MRAMQDSLGGLETQGQVGREGHAGQPGWLRDTQGQVGREGPCRTAWMA